MSWNIQMERGDSLVPRYVKPIMRYCRLPGGLYYLSIVKPGKRIPLETAINMDNYVRDYKVDKVCDTNIPPLLSKFPSSLKSD